MRSFIFNSDFDQSAGIAQKRSMLQRIGRPSRLLILFCAVWLILVECVAQWGFPRLSKIQRRIHEEYEAAVTPDSPVRETRAEVLLLGNSLLNAAVEIPNLAAAMGNWKIKRWIIESTTYYDWYYGLRLLFHKGARPQAICLMLSWQQLAANMTLGEYFAHHLLLTQDFLDVVNTFSLHPTVATSLFVGHLSAFYGSRVEIRKFILGNLLPDLPQLMGTIRPVRMPQDSDHLVELAENRFRLLKAIADEYGTRLIFIVPPALDDGQILKLQQAGRETGVMVLTGWAPGTFSSADFIDGFHLSEQGAQRYTQTLARELHKVLNAENTPH